MYLLSEIHFWSSQDDVVIKNTDFGAFKYYAKKDTQDCVLSTGKKLYCEKRGLTWNPVNKRPFKVKDKLRELEDCLLQNKVVCSFFNVNEIQLLLSKGTLVTIFTNLSDITNISFNKSLGARIQTELISDGAISGQHVACICTDGRVLCMGGLWKDDWVIDGGPKRRICLHEEMLCIWGRVNAEHPQPWAPIKDHQKANVIVYWIGLKGPELLAHKKTEGEPINMVISKVQTKVLISIEQKVSLRGAVSVEVNALEIATLKKVSVISVPLQTQVSCCSLSEDEDRLLLGCIDGSIALLNRNRGSTQIIKTTIIPTLVTWNQSGAIVAISNEKGQLQYFDTALNNVGLQLVGEDCAPVGLLDLSSYLSKQPTITSIKWGPKELIVVLEHGPLILVTQPENILSFTSISLHYLNNNKFEKAIRFLLSWEWNDDSFNVLQKIVTRLLKLPLDKENARHLQEALSCFHSSPVPFDHNIRHKYGRQVRALTRRFFYQLVRYKMFDVAFLLAVDIGHHDLFMDLYYCAVDIGEKEMAAAARAQASALLSKCSSEASFCSRSSCSQCSDSYSESSEDSSSFTESKRKPVVPNLLLRLPQSDENLLSTNFNDVEPRQSPKNLRPPQLTEPRSSPSVAIKMKNVRIPQPDENLLSTNFNDVEPRPSQVKSFPKQNFSKSNFSRRDSMKRVNSIPQVPPLPIAPPLPVAPTLSNFNFTPHYKIPSPPLTKPFIPPPLVQNFEYQRPPPQSMFVPPPLAMFIPPPQAPVVPPPPPLTSNAVKKPPAKVKFSDTVTAFIVPEVKRPVRPAPPAHITNPQKELADSLPLCHPNEDYLKDFTPIRRNETDEEKPKPPRIKVVHFGVV